jgi:hypothetical protein
MVVWNLWLVVVVVVVVSLVYEWCICRRQMRLIHEPDKKADETLSAKPFGR